MYTVEPRRQSIQDSVAPYPKSFTLYNTNITLLKAEN